MIQGRPILFDSSHVDARAQGPEFIRGHAGRGATGKVLFAALLGLLLAISDLNVVNSYVGGDFMTTEQRSMSRVLSMAWLHVGDFAASTVA
jgi:putative ATP-binding cassette transporter